VSGEYRVFVQDTNYTDPLSQEVRIYVVRTHDHAVLQHDGWRIVPEGSPVADPSLRLPSEAMEALVEALDRWRGQPSHAKTEAAVLREWLAAERDRVDHVLTVVGRPIVFDGPSK
jgi:hypothetical protein